MSLWYSDISCCRSPMGVVCVFSFRSLVSRSFKDIPFWLWKILKKVHSFDLISSKSNLSFFLCKSIEAINDQIFDRLSCLVLMLKYSFKIKIIPRRNAQRQQRELKFRNSLHFKWVSCSKKSYIWHTFLRVKDSFCWTFCLSGIVPVVYFSITLNVHNDFEEIILTHKWSIRLNS